MAEGKRFKHQANPQQPAQHQQPIQYQQPQQPGGYAANGYGQGGYSPQPAQFNMEEFEQKPHSAGVIVGLVLGILALLTSIVPIVNNFSFILALIGFVFALVGFIGCARGKKRGKGMGIASLIINILAIVVVLAFQSAWSAAIDEAFRSLLDGPLRATLFARQAALDFTRNKARVVRLMLDLLGDIKD